ncbi:MAG: DUF748 domain-containing protein [Deltaproteobacteria bacterium]|nr:DUF748 domain-containing protein [Deltaproteobacteria bacterium]
MMKGLGYVRSKPAVRKGLIAAGVLALVYTLFGFLALPPILKSVLSKTLSETLHRKVEVRDIRVNPLVLSISVRGLTILERDAPGTWASAEEIFANLQFASVIRGGPVLSEIRLSRPYVKIVRHPDGSYNFTDLIEDSRKKPGDKSRPIKYSFNNIQLVGGSIDFDDGPRKTRHEIRGIQIAIPFISNLRYYVNRYVQPSFAAMVNGKEVSFTGRSKPFSESMETTFDLNISGLDIPHYLEYVPLQRDYEIPSALLDVKAVISFTQLRNRPPTLTAKGDVVLRKVRVSGKDKAPMVYLPMVKAVIFPSNLAARDFHLASLEVRDPELDVFVDRNRKLNLLSLLPEKQKESEDGKQGGNSVTKEGSGAKEEEITIDSIRLTGGRVRFSDASLGSPFKTTLGGLRIDVNGLGTAKGTKADVLVSFSTEAAETIELKGDLSLSPLGSDGAVSIGKLVLKKYAPYYSDAVRFDVDAGALDARSGYHYAKGDGGPALRLSGLEASVSGLRLRKREEKEEFLVIPGFTMKEGEVDLGKKEITIGQVSTAKGSVSVRRSAGGETNVTRLLPAGVESTGPAGAVRARMGPDEEKPAEKPWGITVKETIVDRYSVSFRDRTTDPPVEVDLDRLRLKVENMATGGKQHGKFTFATLYNRQGSVSLGGTFTVDPPSMNATLQAKALPIGQMQPYYAEKVKILLTGGSISALGNVSVDAPKGKPVRAGFRGEVSVNDFSSLDKALEEEFLKFASLHFGGVDVGYNPTSITVREIALTDFYSRIIVHPDGTLNVQGIVAKEGAGRDNAALKTAAAAPADNAAQAPGVPVRIDAVTLLGGTVNFSDKYIKPNYSANLVELGGRVSGLSSEESQLADVDLRGKLGNATPLEIVGKINPLAKDLFLDFKVDFRDIDLSSLSPYSGRYAGYGIQKGKLTLNLRYHIEKKKLDSENKVFLDQFTFGDAVDSPDATKLPVRFAVALLKDRNGEIHLDLPVTGAIDDPKFSVWGVVWKIVGNLLVKAATSPFALLGAVFGGGEELSYLEFDPGSSVIPPSGTAKVGSLVKVLTERPALKLEIEGHVDPDRDKEALRQGIFRGKVTAQKVKSLAKSGQSVPATDNVHIDASEYPRFLTLAYKEEKFPKPRSIIGIAKDLPVPEMEKLMLTHIRVGNDELRQLALERASRVRDQVLVGGKVEPGRVFLVEPKSLAPEKKEKLSDSRVDFRIR